VDFFEKAHDTLMRKFMDESVVKEKVKQVGGEIIEGCGMAISLLHRGKTAEAKKLLANVKRRIRLLTEICTSHPKVLRIQVVKDAKIEYVEAMCYYHYLLKGNIPSYDSLNVEPEEYVLGVADLVGELRRRCLDLIRMGKLELAGKTFEDMVETYEFVWRFEYPKKLVRGLRHKIDVNRRLLDDTRLILTQAHIVGR